ncbi:MAG: phosphotransferase [Gammaproteobacteria bacterium]|nr:phosphotransferase [Gammaproteobacteria bacterium]
MPERLRQLEHWLAHACGLSDCRVEPASADASFRRYFRATRGDGTTLVVMDAPPDKEDCRPFIAVAERMAAAGVHVPTIHAADLEQGFLLLEDLGTTAYLDALGDASADRLYGDAIAALLRLQAGAPTAGLPAYDRDLLRREMQLFSDWLLGRHLAIEPDAAQRAMLDTTFNALVDNALAQPVVCVHRDYHSRNLMVVARDNPGVIDFQDAVAGPVTYDLVSLLRDCYVRWPAQRVDAWLERYRRDAAALGLLDGIDAAQLRAWFDLMGVQRHLKAAGIFARLNHRDGKPGYLGDVPRTLQYVVDAGHCYPATRQLADFVAAVVLPRCRAPYAGATGRS